MPSQPQPHHDDFSETPLVAAPGTRAGARPTAAPTFVRPPSQEIDFARMIKRSDRCRMASRTAIASIGFAGLARSSSGNDGPVALLVAIAFAVLAVIAVGVRFKLVKAPVPHLEH